MATQGRRAGARRRRSSDAQATPQAAAEPAGVIEPAAALTAEPEVELLEDTTVAYTGARRGGSLRRSLTGALVGAFLVVGLAFGAVGPGGVFGPKGEGPSTTDDANPGNLVTAGNAIAANGSYGDHGGDGDEPEATDKPDYDGPDATDKPDYDEPDATDKPDADEPDPTKKPKPEATKKPDKPAEPKPEPKEYIGLALAIKDGHPLLEWGSCGGLDFDYYKVVRSSDATVSWPKGEGDELIAAVEQGGNRRAWDEGAPHGAKAWYRVFCVRSTDDGYKAVKSSETNKIWVPQEETPPDPITLGLEASVDDEGHVYLDWSKCGSEDFGFYKIVRSTTNDNPSYYPWTDGTEVIGVIENKYETELVDDSLESGATAWYRVQCLGWVGDHKVLLGQSAVIEVTVP